MASKSPDIITLPQPAQCPALPLNALLDNRRSHRRFGPGALSLEDIALLLFSAQGVTHRRGYRTAPSAGALYPLEIMLAAGPDCGTGPGAFLLRPARLELEMRAQGDPRAELASACLNQGWMAEAQAMVVISAVYSRVTAKYGPRGEQYAHMEAGCASQNLALAAAALNLGTVIVGAFHEGRVQAAIKAPEQERPLMVMPVGLLPLLEISRHTIIEE